MNSMMPAPGTRDGNWVWDGTRWICQPDCDDDFDRPPFSVLQPGGRHHSPFFPPPVTQPPWYPGANGGVSFAPPGSPPPNPIRGAFWWDGTSLWVFDGAAWDVVGAGAQNVITPPGTTFPPNPAPGQQFFDGKTLWIWDGTAWIPLSQTKTYIQATAPPHPNPGDLWFDGTQLHIWSGSAWDLVGPGATVGPVPTTSEVLSIMASTSISLGGGGWQILNITQTPIIDTLAGWDPVTHKYTPNKPGIYAFFTSSYYGGAGTTEGGHALVKNDQGTFNSTSQMNVTFSFIGGTPNTLGAYLDGFGFVKMNGTTDFVRMFGLIDTGTFFVNPSQPLLHGFLLP